MDEKQAANGKHAVRSNLSIDLEPFQVLLV